jgi:hypothetical protein
MISDDSRVIQWKLDSLFGFQPINIALATRCSVEELTYTIQSVIYMLKKSSCLASVLFPSQVKAVVFAAGRATNCVALQARHSLTQAPGSS